MKSIHISPTMHCNAARRDDLTLWGGIWRKTNMARFRSEKIETTLQLLIFEAIYRWAIFAYTVEPETNRILNRKWQRKMVTSICMPRRRVKIKKLKVEYKYRILPTRSVTRYCVDPLRIFHDISVELTRKKL